MRREDFVHRVPAGGDGSRGGSAGGEQHEAVEDVVVEARRGAQCGVASFDRARHAWADVGVDGGVAFEVAERERDVAGLVGAGEVGDATSQSVGCVAFQEAEQ